VIWVTDGGSGLIKALRDRFGDDLIHVRCGIHKIHNLQRHVKKHLRREVHVRLKAALEQNKYEDAKVMLQEFRGWLAGVNESAARSLDEAQEELLTLHRLGVPTELRRALWTTNAIENLFSTVRHCEHNIKHYRTARMKSRWLAAVFEHAETTFRKVKGYQDIPKVQEKITANKPGQHGLTYRKAA